MWIKVFLLLAARVICKSSLSSELQLLSLIFVQVESSLGTMMTSSGHMTQSMSQYLKRGECDLGWYQFGLYCYMPSSELKTFDHAQRACVYHDANLVSIANKQENAIAFNMSKNFFGFPQSQFVWIGMERRKSTKALHWIDGIDLKYDNWILGEPDSNGACVQMIHNGLWEDTNCYQKMPFICKKRSSYPPPYTRSTELAIMVGIPFVFVFIVLACVGILMFRSIRNADDTIFGYGKRRNKDKMHAAMINVTANIAHASPEPDERRQVTSTPRKLSRTNSRNQSISSSHVNPAIEISDFGSQSPISTRQEDAELERKVQEIRDNFRVPVHARPRYEVPRPPPPLRSVESGIDRRNNNRLSSDVEEIEMQECVVRRSTTSIDREHPSELATSLDQLVTLKPKSRKLRGLRNPEATVRSAGKDGMYRLKTYV